MGGMTSIDREVREHVYEVLQGGSLEEFEEWFVGRTWDERSPLVARIDHLLAEKALLTETALRDELSAVVSTIRYSDSDTLVVTASTAVTRSAERRLGGNQTITRRLEYAGT